ncbi:MAG: divalent-cation tolerance protein CutA [bacterium]
MKEHRFCLAYVTAKDLKQARALARALVRERLAACVNILGKSESIYRWKGRLETGREVALIAKTTTTRAKRLTARVKELHTYDCPCVVIVPIVDGNPQFLKWIGEEVRGTLERGASGA